MHFIGVGIPRMSALFLLCSLSFTSAAVELEAERSRGEMLYSLHCIACHNKEIHWRDQKLVGDWPSLILQIRRWQNIAGLGWEENDIEASAQYLNKLYYRLSIQEKP